MTRKVDPIHFFDQLGNSMVNRQHLEKRNAELEAEVERLNRMLEARNRKEAATTVSVDPPGSAKIH